MLVSRLLRRTFSTITAATHTNVPKEVYTSIYNERHLKTVVDKFKKASELYRFRRNSAIYEYTIRRLAASKRFKWIEEILEDQKRYDDMTKEGFGVRLISLYGKAGMYENARKLFAEMPQHCKLTVLSFNALLAACVNSKKFDKMELVFNDLPKELSIEPDLFSYNTIIKGFCEKGSIESGMSMFDEMQQKGLLPDLITFNTLLNGCYARGHFVEGEMIWAQLSQKNLVPDIRSYNARLAGLASEKRADEAVGLVEEMKEKHIEPDVFTFNALIKAFVNEENLEEARKWYSEIGKNDCKPNRATFATLIPFLCDKGEVEFAFEVCEEMFSKKCLVGEGQLQKVVDALVNESHVDKAEKVVALGTLNSFRRYKLKLPVAE